MARKFCPACNKLNAGSATRCHCGHEFAASTIVQPRTSKHCPECKREQPLLLEVCGCGHRFEDVRELREELEERVRMGWSYVALGVTLFAIGTGIMIATSFLWMFAAFGGVALAGRGFATRADARAELRALRAVAGVLPSAKVVRRPE